MSHLLNALSQRRVTAVIQARPARWAKHLFDPYLNRLLKRHFHGIYLLGDLPGPDPALPLLLAPNHSSWWDGFLAYFLNLRRFGRPFYVMMLESELSKYPFFSRLGAYSIDPGQPKSVVASLQYTVKLLDRSPAPLVSIFPQGELLPWGKRPLNFKRGIAWLGEHYPGKVNILPLAIRCEHLGEQRPEAFFLFGKNLVCGPGNFPGIRALEELEESLLQDLALRIVNREKGEPLLQGRLSLNRKVDLFFGKTAAR